MTLTQKLQAKLNELMAERETTSDKYWIDLEIEDLEVKIAKASKLNHAPPRYITPLSVGNQGETR